MDAWTISSKHYGVACTGETARPTREGEQTAARPMVFEEASTTFDLEDVEPFLERVAQLVDAGFTDREILEIKRLAGVMTLDAEETLAFAVQYQDRTIPLRITIFMDDLAAPDVYFFTDPDLAQEINREMQQFAEEQGV